MDESKIVADKYGLVDNTGVFQNTANEASNSYFDMFGASDMSTYPEILLWKQYSQAAGVVNSVVEFAAAANQGWGMTKACLTHL